ncbi:MAG: DUF2075 domain-containing protein [Flavobacteriales bacterium]|nr:DUF2075 domain-containing protein [Flavobacteriales bacterium]
MKLYAGSSLEFIRLNHRNQLAGELKTAFFNSLGYNPSDNEVMSWRNSLSRMAILLEEYKLNDHGIMVEYQLPMNSKRIDVIICGKRENNQKHSIIIELKQWERCQLNDYDSERVLTYVGGGNRSVLHPSIQVGNYKYYLEFNQTAFYDEKDPISLSACSYLHNYAYDVTDPIFDKRFEQALEEFPVFTNDDYDRLGQHLIGTLPNGNGVEIIQQIEKSKYAPSKKLLNHLSQVIKDKLSGNELAVIGKSDDYVLLDEQLIVYDAIISIIKAKKHLRKKHVLIIKGGPGTGKSVIAIKLLADLSAKGHLVNYATGSKAFTETLRKVISIKGGNFFKYFNSYTKALNSGLDVLILDEAHRIRKSSASRFQKSTGYSQIVELINASKITVMFLDELQAVRKGEIGSVDYFKEQAMTLNCEILEFELESQFRCGGSNGYINWVTNTLQLQRTANPLWKNNEDFEFQIASSPEQLEEWIKAKVDLGFTGRITAGFCWPWSKELSENGTLKNDVKIGTFERPWNAPPDLRGLPKNIPSANFWALDPNGLHQIGCIYTVQSFEFDYCAVIIGEDLVFDFNKGEWMAQFDKSFDSGIDKNNALTLIKNTYRVLLTRGMKGCFVYFMNKDTENFFKSRLEK